VDTNFWKNPADVNSDEDVRQTSSPEEALLEFLQNTYEVSANLGNWDRSALERITHGVRMKICAGVRTILFLLDSPKSLC
jgi:spore cortex formation protein SpoVR/YcgB (stage V sporulation)